MSNKKVLVLSLAALMGLMVGSVETMYGAPKKAKVISREAPATVGTRTSLLSEGGGMQKAKQSLGYEAPAPRSFEAADAASRSALDKNSIDSWKSETQRPNETLQKERVPVDDLLGLDSYSVRETAAQPVPDFGFSGIVERNDSGDWASAFRQDSVFSNRSISHKDATKQLDAQSFTEFNFPEASVLPASVASPKKINVPQEQVDKAQTNEAAAEARSAEIAAALKKLKLETAAKSAVVDSSPAAVGDALVSAQRFTPKPPSGPVPEKNRTSSLKLAPTPDGNRAPVTQERLAPGAEALTPAAELAKMAKEAPGVLGASEVRKDLVRSAERAKAKDPIAEYNALVAERAARVQELATLRQKLVDTKTSGLSPELQRMRTNETQAALEAVNQRIQSIEAKAPAAAVEARVQEIVAKSKNPGLTRTAKFLQTIKNAFMTKKAVTKAQVSRLNREQATLKSQVDALNNDIADKQRDVENFTNNKRPEMKKMLIEAQAVLADLQQKRDETLAVQASVDNLVNQRAQELLPKGLQGKINNGAVDALRKPMTVEVAAPVEYKTVKAIDTRRAELIDALKTATLTGGERGDLQRELVQLEQQRAGQVKKDAQQAAITRDQTAALAKEMKDAPPTTLKEAQDLLVRIEKALNDGRDGDGMINGVLGLPLMDLKNAALRAVNKFRAPRAPREQAQAEPVPLETQIKRTAQDITMDLKVLNDEIAKAWSGNFNTKAQYLDKNPAVKDKLAALERELAETQQVEAEARGKAANAAREQARLDQLKPAEAAQQAKDTMDMMAQRDAFLTGALDQNIREKTAQVASAEPVPLETQIKRTAQDITMDLKVLNDEIAKAWSGNFNTKAQYLDKNPAVKDKLAALERELAETQQVEAEARGKAANAAREQARIDQLKPADAAQQAKDTMDMMAQRDAFLTGALDQNIREKTAQVASLEKGLRNFSGESLTKAQEMLDGLRSELTQMQTQKELFRTELATSAKKKDVVFAEPDIATSAAVQALKKTAVDGRQASIDAAKKQAALAKKPSAGSSTDNPMFNREGNPPATAAVVAAPAAKATREIVPLGAPSKQLMKLREKIKKPAVQAEPESPRTVTELAVEPVAERKTTEQLRADAGQEAYDKAYAANKALGFAKGVSTGKQVETRARRVATKAKEAAIKAYQVEASPQS